MIKFCRIASSYWELNGNSILLGTYSQWANHILVHVSLVGLAGWLTKTYKKINEQIDVLD